MKPKIIDRICISRCYVCHDIINLTSQHLNLYMIQCPENTNFKLTQII